MITGVGTDRANGRAAMLLGLSPEDITALAEGRVISFATDGHSDMPDMDVHLGMGDERAMLDLIMETSPEATLVD